jgi:hypothetical protein
MQKTSKLTILSGLLLLVILAAPFIWAFFSSSPEIKVAILSFLAAAFAAIISNHQTRLREIEARQFIEKNKAYNDILELILEIFTKSRSGGNVEEGVLIERIMKFKKNLIIWGGSESIQAWIDYEELCIEKREGQEILAAMENIFRVIRKELGHQDQGLKFGKLTALFLVSKDRVTAFPNAGSKAA